MPELEQQKDTNIVQLAEFNRQIKDLEKKILKLVSEAGEDILEDEELIEVLDQSKITSNNIWSHPSFRRDSPALAKTITRKRPRPAKAAAPATEGLGLPPLVAGGAALASSSNGASSDDEASGGNPSAAAKAPRLRFAPETPSPEVAARLAALREQLRAEKQAAKTLQETLDRLEDSSTKARREELQV